MNKSDFASPIAALAATMTAMASTAFAEGEKVIGKPVDGGIWLQPSVGAVGERTAALNVGTIWLSAAITLFVTVLLAIVVIRFRDTGKAPRRFSHNTPLEIVWTLVPVLILVVLAFFSVPALKDQLDHPEGDLVVKAIGNQWYWSYEYAEEGLAFDSFMLQREQLAEFGYADDEYLLAVDNALVVPANKDIIVEIVSADVQHAWKVPAFAVMADALPGRTQIVHFNVPAGTYFGQCSELCGKNHAFMPITVKVLEEAEYQAWLDGAREEFASLPATIEVASK